jgi:hypothetical protein
MLKVAPSLPAHDSTSIGVMMSISLSPPGSHVGFPSIVLKNSAEYPTNSFTNTCKAIGRKDPAQNISCIHIL